MERCGCGGTTNMKNENLQNCTNDKKYWAYPAAPIICHQRQNSFQDFLQRTSSNWYTGIPQNTKNTGSNSTRREMCCCTGGASTRWNYRALASQKPPNDYKERVRNQNMNSKFEKISNYWKNGNNESAGSNTSLGIVRSTRETKVLCIYTGGTIGMIRNDDDRLAPIPNMFTQKIKSYPQLNDMEYIAKRFPSGTDFFVLPYSSEPCRVLYRIVEYEPLLDSSNMSINDWIRIAEDIKKHYEQYDGFVILHGTDTLIYTAAALSFMLENLGKTIVLTGSQIPLFENRSDGKDNFLSAVIFAGNYVIPEVTIFFGHTLFRGNRTIKKSLESFNAFESPNAPHLAETGINIVVHERCIFRPTTVEKFSVHTNLNQNVGLLRLFPSITDETVELFLKPPIEGVVLQSYGAGNVPSNRPKLLKILKEATDRNVLIVNCTQCMEGSVEEIYETGSHSTGIGIVSGLDMTPEAALTKLSYVLSKKEWDLETKKKVLKKIGVVSGKDMSPEAALVKLSYVLSKDDWDLATKKQMMSRNIRGEISSGFSPEVHKWELVEAVAKSMQLTAPDDVQHLNNVLCPVLVIAAVVENDMDKLRLLKSQGADICLSNSDKRTCLHVASALGRTDFVEYLLSNGCSVHVRDRWDKTPLQDAIENDQHEVIKLLVKAGAHLSSSIRFLGEDLCLAAARGSVKRLESYRLAGTNLSQIDSCGRTALHIAAMHGNVEVAKFLLDQGCNPRTGDNLGITAEKIAQIRNQMKILNLFKNY